MCPPEVAALSLHVDVAAAQVEAVLATMFFLYVLSLGAFLLLLDAVFQCQC